MGNSTICNVYLSFSLSNNALFAWYAIKLFFIFIVILYTGAISLRNMDFFYGKTKVANSFCIPGKIQIDFDIYPVIVTMAIILRRIGIEWV